MSFSDAYFRFLAAGNEDDEWAWYSVDAMSDPEDAWSKILKLLAAANSDLQVSLVGAGPLEDLLTYHGDEFVERVEASLDSVPSLQAALGHVVFSGVKPEVLERLRSALRARS